MIISFGMAVALVEKGDTYPIRKPKLILKRFIHKYVSRKFAKVLECSTCTSFWMALFVDICLFFITGGAYFFWPLSGFATVGFTWWMIEFLNAVDNNIKE